MIPSINMVTTKEILDTIESGGHRPTASRRRVLDAVVARGDGFTAEELVAEVKGLGRATIYRTVRLLLKEGLLCKLSLQDGAPRYTLFHRLGHHHHLVCVGCGVVQEFRQSVIEQMLMNLEASGTGTIMGHRIEVYVLCPACLPKVGS
ncbi:MAG: transcriptional repressor [Dehalococcoidia bacterium]|nr:transcriptional repressor [Dehalococcoidia bacterium]